MRCAAQPLSTFYIYDGNASPPGRRHSVNGMPYPHSAACRWRGVALPARCTAWHGVAIVVMPRHARTCPCMDAWMHACAGLLDVLQGENLRSALRLQALLCLVDMRAVGSAEWEASETYRDQVNAADIIVGHKQASLWWRAGACSLCCPCQWSRCPTHAVVWPLHVCACVHVVTTCACHALPCMPAWLHGCMPAWLHGCRTWRVKRSRRRSGSGQQRCTRLRSRYAKRELQPHHITSHHVHA